MQAHAKQVSHVHLELGLNTKMGSKISVINYDTEFLDAKMK